MAMPSDWMNFFTLCVYPKLNSSWNTLFSLKITSTGKASLIPFCHPMWRCRSLRTRLSLYFESASTLVLMILNYDLFVHISVCLLEVRDYILFISASLLLGTRTAWFLVSFQFTLVELKYCSSHTRFIWRKEKLDAIYFTKSCISECLKLQIKTGNASNVQNSHSSLKSSHFIQ